MCVSACTPVFYFCFCLPNFGACACTPVFYSCYVHLFCRSEQSVSSLNICTADSPPHTGQHNTYQLLYFLYFICILFVFHCFTFCRLFYHWTGQQMRRIRLSISKVFLHFYDCLLFTLDFRIPAKGLYLDYLLDCIG